jgi:hypothetical protein
MMAMATTFLPFAESAKGRCPRSGRRGHGPEHDPSGPAGHLLSEVGEEG